METLRKTEREDGQSHAPLVLSFPNGFEAQTERQTTKATRTTDRESASYFLRSVVQRMGSTSYVSRVQIDNIATW